MKELNANELLFGDIGDGEMRREIALGKLPPFYWTSFLGARFSCVNVLTAKGEVGATCYFIHCIIRPW